MFVQNQSEIKGCVTNTFFDKFISASREIANKDLEQ